MAPRSGATQYSYNTGHRFSEIPSVNTPRSVFNRSHGVKTGFNSGLLIPIFCDEALPGDTLALNTTAFMRASTPVYPVMDNLWADFFFFAVPIRLIWNNWQKFNGEQTDPGDSTDFLVPTMTENVAEESLSDYLGLPIGIAGLEFSSFFHRAYNLIWNEWFRDENLQDSLVVDLDDGPDTPGDYVLKRRGKRHDYFTSCLPFAQKGTAIELPLGTAAPIVGLGAPTFDVANLTGATIGSENTETTARWSGSATSTDATAVWNDPQLQVDLSAATAATVNELREAFQVQKLLERDARGGTRYTEIVRSHFGVVSPDQRLQRPEFIGGGSVMIQTTPIASTAELGARPVGNVGGFQTGLGSNMGFMKSFTEHCVLLGLVSIRADLTYQEGMNRMFNRRTRYDFYWPSLAHLGEQAVLNKEIYAQGDANDDLVFGYQERYAEYRHKPSMTTGPMRSTHSTPLDSWHYGLDFAALPLLNESFIEDNPPVSRTLAVAGELASEFIGDFYFQYRCARPMPTFGVPGLIDHF